MIEDTADANFRWSVDLLTALHRRGVDHVVISSGSRCAPLVLAAANMKGPRIWTQIDERSAAFFALGIGKATRRPAALICTSGTAAANYFPAVIEARMSHTPLVVLSADRPPELRGCGAPQTIDQVNLYGRYPLYFSDLPGPGPDATDRKRWTDEAVNAMNAALGCPHGPVHLNLPYREPLLPMPPRLHELAAATGFPEQASQDQKSDSHPASPPMPEARTWDALAAALRSTERGLIVCGPQNSSEGLAETVADLCRLTGFPVIADIASQVRLAADVDTQVISHFDLILSNPQLADALAPEIVLRIGGLPTSKRLNLWFNDVPVTHHIVIDDQPEIADPYRQSTSKILSPFELIATELGSRMNGSAAGRNDYAADWYEADKRAANFLSALRDGRAQCFEGDIVNAVFENASPGAVVYLSNSMPIRLADKYVAARPLGLRVLVNRGANGIDGIVSSAAGAATVSTTPVVLVIGDQAMLHDLNGLLPVHRYDLNLKIILLNNDGGGIFAFLPVAEHTEASESLVAMPHGRDFADAVRFYGIAYSKHDTLDDFTAAYRACLTRSAPEILEVRSERRETLALSQEIDRRFAELDGSLL